ncbi:SusC/RagA family TonB-linked outer membrane protein [Chitinophaga sp. Hz27]|uniref:SusC/RagA family TonB-linked outer membrane protein n=1 Tax=Chitinophaga sp. Hz27 TaxID=3347169 RepID=UPI0035E095A5
MLLLLIATVVKGQTANISGKVTDHDNGDPIPGVTVRIKGKNTAVQTDAKGTFSLSATPQDILIVSIIGYNTIEQTVGTSTNLKIQLSGQAIALKDLVVVGYGTQKKANLTGALTSLKTEEITKRQVASTSNLLQGLAPGVMVTQQSGKPGTDGATIKIRGEGSIYAGSSPLILVDGVQMNMDAVDPNTIESITVLKDAASTAIYGSRATNGVVLVTTRRGKGNGLAMQYNAYLSKQQATNLPEKVSAIEHMQYANVARQNTTGNPNAFAFDTALINKYKQNPADNFNYFNTDWEKLVLTNNGLMQNHNLNLSLGSENIKFFASGTYLKQQGLTPNTYYTKYDVRMNADIKISEKVSLRGDYIYNKVARNEPAGSTPEFIIKQMLGMPANAAGKFADGKYGDAGQSAKRNPIGQAEASGINLNETPSNILKATLVYRPVKELEFEAWFSNNTYNAHNKKFVQNYAVYRPDYAANQLVFDTYYPAQNMLSEAYSNNKLNYYTIQGTFNKTIGDHEIKFLAGFQAEDFSVATLGASRTDFPSNDPFMNIGTKNINNSGGASAYFLESFYGRLNYAYKGKYLLELNGRADGSSRFSQEFNNQWGYYPSVSAGWILSQEKFFEGLNNVVSFAKIRASYGSLGNQSLNEYYPFVATLNTTTSNYYFNSKNNAGVAQTDAANPMISWEKSTQKDIGADFLFLKDRLSLTFDYYSKEVSAMLLKRPIPNYVGLGAPYINIGSMKNTGWELALGWKDKIGKFRYDVGFNLSDVRNKVKDLGGVDIIDGAYITTPGSAIRSYYGYVADGYYQNADEVTKGPFFQSTTKPGDIRYKDFSGPEGKPDGKIDAYDRKVLGNSMPHYEYSLNLNGYWKNFDVNIFLQGVGKRDNYVSGTGAWAFYSGDFIGTMYSWQKDYWTPTNPNAAYPRLTENPSFPTSTFWMKNGAYLRLKNIALGYTFNGQQVKFVKIQSLRVYVSGSNLFTHSNYAPGFDPEMNNINGEFYPVMKTFTAGLNLKF